MDPGSTRTIAFEGGLLGREPHALPVIRVR